MINAFHPQDPGTWAKLHFAGAQLGDVRRTQQAKVMAEAFAENPGQSIPQLFAHPYAVKAAYSFFDRPESTPQRLQAGHRELVLKRLKEQPGVYLLVEDGSEISFSGMNKPIEGLGFIGNAKEGLLKALCCTRCWPCAGLGMTTTGAKSSSLWSGSC